MNLQNETRLRVYLATLIFGTLALRAVLAWLLGYGYGEGYYVLTARFPALSYFDQPPLSLWTTALFAWLSGSEEPFWLRLPFVLMFAGTTWAIYRLTAELFTPRAGVLAALLLNCSAVLTVSVGNWVQPDGPLFLFWSLAILFLARAVLSEPKQGAWQNWLIGGLCLGLALLSKYHALFIVFGGGLFLMTQVRARGWLLRPQPYVAAGIALLIFTPVLIWNAENAWISFRFQGGRGFGGEFDFPRFLLNIAGQAGFMLPWIWLGLVWAAWRAIRRGAVAAETWLLICLAIGPIATFTLVSLWSPVGFHFHWQAPGYLMLFPLLGDLLDRYWPLQTARVRAYITASSAALLILIGLAATQATTSLAQRLFPGQAIGMDPTLELHSWQQLSQRPPIAAAIQEDRFFVVPRWHQAGKLATALGPGVPVLCLCDDPRNVAFGWRHEEFRGRNAILIGESEFTAAMEMRLAPHFDSIGPATEFRLERGGLPALSFQVHEAEGYRGTYPLGLPPN